MFAKARGKPLWKLIVDFSPEEYVESPHLMIRRRADGRYVKAMSWRYISDAITKDEALAMLKAKEATKKEREAEVKKRGYPAYTTSVGWLGVFSLFYFSQN
jgi:L-fuconate dehydratase